MSTKTTTTHPPLGKGTSYDRNQRVLGHDNITEDRHGSRVWDAIVSDSCRHNSLNHIESGVHVQRENLPFSLDENQRNSYGTVDDTMAEHCRVDSFNPVGCRSPGTSGSLPNNLSSNDGVGFGMSNAAIPEFRDNSFVNSDTRSPTTWGNLHYNRYNKSYLDLLRTEPETLDFQSFTSNACAKPQDINLEDILNDVDTRMTPASSDSKRSDSSDAPTISQLAEGVRPELTSNPCTCLQQHAEFLSNPKLSEKLASNGPEDGVLFLGKTLFLVEKGMKAWQSLITCTTCRSNGDQEVMLLTFMSIRTIVRYLQRTLPCYAATQPSGSNTSIPQSPLKESSVLVGPFEVTGNSTPRRKSLFEETANRTARIDDYQESSSKMKSRKCTYTLRRTQKSQKLQKVLTVQPLAPAEKGIDHVAPYRMEELGATARSVSSKEGSPPLIDHEDDDDEDFLIPREIRDPSFQSRVDGPYPNKGRLFVAQGKSRYIDGCKAEQVANFEKVFSNEPSLGDEEGRLPLSSPKSECGVASPNDILDGGFIFGQSNRKRNLRIYYPSTEIVRLLWQYYVENVDILVKILHKPTVEALIMSCLEDPKKIDASTEALLFAIYFSTVTTMSTEECLALHGEERRKVLPRYRYALEQALAQAGLLTTQEVVILQAVILLIVCSPRKDPRSTWMLSGTALRVAQAMGMHRDSAYFSLSTVDIEVRRRVWWTLCLIDNRISEDCGLESNVPMTMDTKLPLHINDSDIAAENIEALIPNTGFTEMTASLIKIEMAETVLKFKLSQYGKCPLSVEETETLIRELTGRYESTYLKCLDTSLHLHRLVYLGTRLIIAKLWRILYDPLQRNDPAVLDGEEIKERLLLYNTEVVEITHQLPDKSSKFGWFFLCKYTRWHAMAYLLIELCSHTEGPGVDRAWAALNAVFGGSGDENKSTRTDGVQEIEKSMLWQPLQKLLKRACHVREQAALKAQSEESINALTHDSGYDSYDTNSIPTEDIIQTWDEKSSGDPFLGSMPDLGSEMNWEKWDDLVYAKSFQANLLQEQVDMNYGGNDPTLTLSWW
ncbi:hypothetical protein G7Y89_g5305 [Cudoniella acicularis]|uniref:Xylanolytic transcriptional activator regulatory domain-containing protein n=1 Tax=Cudoniella acicularis TaxID=354080 RepID=A0A8H4W5U7_9HELO|nr:hypothetical protein G7Y89_g5305 [Cudoniella acicularis]